MLVFSVKTSLLQPLQLVFTHMLKCVRFDSVKFPVCSYLREKITYGCTDPSLCTMATVNDDRIYIALLKSGRIDHLFILGSTLDSHLYKSKYFVEFLYELRQLERITNDTQTFFLGYLKKSRSNLQLLLAQFTDLLMNELPMIL